jgi:hypothetical protein
VATRSEAEAASMTAVDPPAPLSRQRRFTTPRPDETLDALAARALPDEAAEAAADKIRSWNLHISVMRRPPGLLLNSDVVFVEPPL